MFIYMYLLFDISSAQSPSVSFSLLLSLSVSLHVLHIPTFPHFPLFGYCYCSAYLCHTIFDTLFWIFFQTIYPCLHLSRYVNLYIFDLQWHYYFINLYVWLFLFLSIFLFKMLPLNCFIASLSLLMPLSLFWCLSHSLCSCTSLISLLSFSISCSISLLLYL